MDRMDTDEYKRKLAAILSADVKDYSRLMRDNETETVKAINKYREIITHLIHQHHGRVVDSPGDNLLAEFASVVDGVQAAVAIQKELKVLNTKVAPNRKMEFRIGINLGDIIEERDRIYGDGVNIAARLEALAEAGGICISRTAYDQIEDKLPLGYKYLGEKNVKNIPKPIQAYKVLFEPEDVTSKKETRTTERIRKEKKPKEIETGLPQSKEEIEYLSDKKRLLSAIICAAFGIFGAHRFYVGKLGTGFLQLLTIGGLGIWYVVDFLVLLFGEFTDGQGRKIKKWI